MDHAKQHKHQRADEVRELAVIDCFTVLDEGRLQFFVGFLLAFRIVRFRSQFTQNRRDDNESGDRFIAQTCLGIVS